MFAEEVTRAVEGPTFHRVAQHAEITQRESPARYFEARELGNPVSHRLTRSFAI